MKIAVLISGRAARYEVCLIHALEKRKYDYDLFISVNDEPCKYYEIMEERLKYWIKGLKIKPFLLPEDFENHYSHPIAGWSPKQNINGKFVPHHVMSMFYNNTEAFNMAIKYADDNGFEYDSYLKFRSDIVIDDFPNIQKTDNLLIYSVIPVQCNFTVPILNRENNSLGKHVPIVSDCIAYGNRKSMKIYCEAYNYILETNRLLNNNYQIHGESCCTQNIYHNNVPVERFNYTHKFDRNRKIFDLTWENVGTEHCKDNRIYNVPGSLSPIDIKTVETTDDIPPIGGF